MGKTQENDIYEYLCVDGFLSGFLELQSLKTAFELGLIDQLIGNKNVSKNNLIKLLAIEPDGLNVLLDVLASNNITHRAADRVYLTEDFRKALRFRDLMEIKIEFANYVTPDVLDDFTCYFRDLETFMERSSIFDLFSYHRCYEPTIDNITAAKKWMRYTTIFTRYETPVCFKHFDISRYQSLLDVGGNSGEFALQACSINTRLHATVLDLPVVCEAGRDHVSGQDGADRLRFHAADGLTDDFPGVSELISFKSILHDWPEGAVEILLSKAAEKLAETGTILIFERMKPTSLMPMPGYGNLPVFLFIRFYRTPDFYRTVLEKMGFNKIEIKIIQLEMPFMLVSAKKR